MRAIFASNTTQQNTTEPCLTWRYPRKRLAHEAYEKISFLKTVRKRTGPFLFHENVPLHFYAKCSLLVKVTQQYITNDDVIHGLIKALSLSRYSSSVMKFKVQFNSECCASKCQEVI